MVSDNSVYSRDVNLDHGMAVLRRRFGERAVLARGAGRWSVIIMERKNFGSGTCITDECPTISRAVSQAIKYGIENGIGVLPPFDS